MLLLSHCLNTLQNCQYLLNPQNHSEDTFELFLTCMHHFDLMYKICIIILKMFLICDWVSCIQSFYSKELEEDQLLLRNLLRISSAKIFKKIISYAKNIGTGVPMFKGFVTKELSGKQES